MQRYNYFLIKILSSGKIIKTIVYYPIVETGGGPAHHRLNSLVLLTFRWVYNIYLLFCGVCPAPPPVSTTRYFF